MYRPNIGWNSSASKRLSFDPLHELSAKGPPRGVNKEKGEKLIFKLLKKKRKILRGFLFCGQSPLLAGLSGTLFPLTVKGINDINKVYQNKKASFQAIDPLFSKRHGGKKKKKAGKDGDGNIEVDGRSHGKWLNKGGKP